MLATKVTIVNQRLKPFLFRIPISKVVDEYNGIAHVFQTFYAKDSENFEERGITSYQLVYFNNRWWIANIVWTGDSNGVKVPAKYLKK